MKILHTADWHLGKRLYNRSRMDEQREALAQIVAVADEKRVDAVVLSGDIYDTVVPPAESEVLFYETALRLSNGRAFIPLAGNHDDDRRIASARAIANRVGIVMSDNLDYSDCQTDFIKGFFGGVRLQRGGERVDIAVLPYPSEQRLARYFNGELNVLEEYTARVSEAIKRVTAFYDSDYTILATHVFTGTAEKESELGGAKILPADIFNGCDYCALGHVHKNWAVTKTAAYCGAILQYDYGASPKNYVNIIDTKLRTVEKVEITCGRRLVTEQVSNYDEAVAVLEKNAQCFVKLIYSGAPLSVKQTQTLSSYDCFNAIEVRVEGEKSELVMRNFLTDEELFIQYYKTKRGEEPDEKTVALFLQAMRGEL